MGLTKVHYRLSPDLYPGLLLILATVVALLMSNTQFYEYYQVLFYQRLLSLPPSSVWINDGLMAVFFFLIGLELKEERCEGSLKNTHHILMPGVAALGGVFCPMLIYTFFNFSNPIHSHGFAIPMATDIAFCVAVLSCFGKRIPPRVRIFLLTLAVLDDLAAIMVIAVFYAADLKMAGVVFASLACFILWRLHYRRVNSLYAYLAVGLFLWGSILYSGIHPTLSGVILAFFIPLNKIKPLIKALKPWISYAILPVFALANAGLRLEGVEFSTLLHPVFLGVFLGLLVGKPVGVFLFSKLYVAIMRHPSPLTEKEILVVGVLAGIGFTMSLFIASLSFDASQQELLKQARLGILTASLMAMMMGLVCLGAVVKKKKKV